MIDSPIHYIYAVIILAFSALYLERKQQEFTFSEHPKKARSPNFTLCNGFLNRQMRDTTFTLTNKVCMSSLRMLLCLLKYGSWESNLHSQHALMS